jgi:hypothetical protein
LKYDQTAEETMEKLYVSKILQNWQIFFWKSQKIFNPFVERGK